MCLLRTCQAKAEASVATSSYADPAARQKRQRAGIMSSRHQAAITQAGEAVSWRPQFHHEGVSRWTSGFLFSARALLYHGRNHGVVTSVGQSSPSQEHDALIPHLSCFSLFSLSQCWGGDRPSSNKGPWRTLAITGLSLKWGYMATPFPEATGQ